MRRVWLSITAAQVLVATERRALAYGPVYRKSSCFNYSGQYQLHSAILDGGAASPHLRAVPERVIRRWTIGDQLLIVYITGCIYFPLFRWLKTLPSIHPS